MYINYQAIKINLLMWVLGTMKALTKKITGLDNSWIHRGYMNTFT